MWILAAAALLLQAAQEERLRRLEEEARRQQAEIEDLTRPEGDRLTVSLADGLRVRSADGEFDFHLGGRFIENGRDIRHRPGGPRTDPDGFCVRQAVLSIDGALARDFRVLLRANVTSSPSGPSGSLATSYLEWRPSDAFRLAFGQFRGPLGQESLTATLFTDLAERSIVYRFQPGVELGAQARGEIAGGVLEWFLDVTDGRSHLYSEGRLRNDDNDEKELMARVVAAPWAPEEASILRRLRLGAYGSATDVDDVPMATDFEIATTELSVLFFDPAGGSLDGRRTRLGAELSWAAGPVSLAAEALLRRDEIAGGGVEETLPIRAWYAGAAWVLTGEEKVPGQRVRPGRPFDPAAGAWGAFEIVLRAAGARLGHEAARVGAPFAGQSDGVRTWTAGLNWHLAANARLAANVVREDYGEAIDFGGGRRERALTGFILRTQVDF